VPGLEIAATMLPATEVGGDYYDVLPTPRGCWIGIGDVAGHGLRPGLVMMMLQSIVSALVRSNPESAPRDVLRVVNAVLYENVRERLGQDEHATLSLIRYRESGELLFAGAHEDMLVLRADSGQVEAVPTLGTWVGATKDIDEATQDTRYCLRDGDVLLLYTDLMRELASAGAGAEPAQLIRDRLCAAVTEFMDEQRDDIALLVARFRAPS
jgi:sigma-B regulation protein RsbU (phosphoserine phosphatase)